MTTSPDLLPPHYRVEIRRLVRFAAVFLFVGLLLGIVSTEMQLGVRYGREPRHLDEDTRKAEHTRAVVDLPPGLNWESGMDLRISHGHVVLLGGVVPLCLAAALVVTRAAGGAAIGEGTLRAAFALYAPGACAAMVLIVYKGMSLALAMRDPASDFDLRAVQAGLFLGSRAVKGAAYGISHSVLAIAVGVYSVALWSSASSIGSGARAVPPAVR